MEVLKKVWEGRERLVITFWVWGFLGSLIVGFIIGFLLGAMPTVANLVSLPYAIFIWVGIWRSSNNYKGQKIWALLAKIMVVLGILFTIYTFFNPQPLSY